MRLSRLSNRQMKRLLARGEVRFGDEKVDIMTLKKLSRLHDLIYSSVDVMSRSGYKEPEIKELIEWADRNRFNKAKWAFHALRDYQIRLKEIKKNLNLIFNLFRKYGV